MLDVCARFRKKKISTRFDRGAFAACWSMAFESRRRNKVTARFIDIADLAREAHYDAAARGEAVVRAAHVRGALSSKMERHNLIETRIREMIEEVAARRRQRHASRPGQRAERARDRGYSFGKPVRITATAAWARPA